MISKKRVKLIACFVLDNYLVLMDLDNITLITTVDSMHRLIMGSFIPNTTTAIRLIPMSWNTVYSSSAVTKTFSFKTNTQQWVHEHQNGCLCHVWYCKEQTLSKEGYNRPKNHRL